MGGNRTTALVILAAAVWICRLRVELSATRQNGATPDERVALLTQSLQDTQSRLRGYEWIETTVITVKGEERDVRSSARVHRLCGTRRPHGR
jgi:hypothetical protein